MIQPTVLVAAITEIVGASVTTRSNSGRDSALKELKDPSRKPLNEELKMSSHQQLFLEFIEQLQKEPSMATTRQHHTS